MAGSDPISFTIDMMRTRWYGERRIGPFHWRVYSVEGHTGKETVYPERYYSEPAAMRAANFAWGAYHDGIDRQRDRERFFASLSTPTRSRQQQEPA